MIFDLTRDYVPETYVESRDYRVLLRELGMLITVLKYNIDRLPDLYSADRCPEHLLPLLASKVGYRYNYDKTVSHNRNIIKNYPYLIRNRGSELGIKLAITLSVNTSPYVSHPYSTSSIIVVTDVGRGVVTVYYPNVEVVDWGLIEVVRPIGMRIDLIRSEITTPGEEIDLDISVRSIKRHKSYDTSYVDGSQTNYDNN